MSTVKDEVYVSVDIETDGPIPGPHSMLSLGAAAFKLHVVGSELHASKSAEWTMNFMTLPNATGAPATMEWWKTQPQAWAACRTSPRSVPLAMEDFNRWVLALGGKAVFVAYPAGFDFTFVYWYLMRYVGSSPFSHSALDMKTLAMALLKSPYREATKRNFRDAWQGQSRNHTHIALDDAIEQGESFCAMMAELEGLDLVFKG